MSKFPFIDIHTHTVNNTKGVISLVNIFPEEYSTIKTENNYSIGLHPWYINKTKLNSEIDILRKAVFSENILAIGEIGIDGFRSNFELQKLIFIKQAKLAQSANKPLIIHCVKAYSILISIIKKNKITVPKIIHAFNSSIEIAEQLIKLGCYLSFGKILSNPKSKAVKIISELPDDKIFFETDFQDLKINDIYNKAADLKEIKTSVLKEIIYKNYQHIFGNP